MRATVHIADLGSKSLLEVIRRRPKPDDVAGLTDAHVATSAPLRTGPVPSLSPGRVGLVAMWADDAAIDEFEAEHPVAELLSSGWSVRLEPLRRWGEWPGLPESVPTDRSPGRDLPGPFAVLTLARTRWRTLPRFLRTSEQAEKAAVESPGLIWGTAMAMPPFFATCSLWDSTKSLSTYAYGRSDPRHSEAMKVNEQRRFHHDEAFVRFRPYASKGELRGKNPLPADWATLSLTRTTTEPTPTS